MPGTKPLPDEDAAEAVVPEAMHFKNQDALIVRYLKRMHAGWHARFKAAVRSVIKPKAN